MNFRLARGRLQDWVDTSIAAGFSNFLFIDQHYQSNAVLRRIFSLARRLDYKSLLIEEIVEADCKLLADENAALRIRRPNFERSVVWRLSFWLCAAKDRNPSGFLGYAIVKQDYLKGDSTPSQHVYESVLQPFRTKTENNFVHCAREYDVSTAAGTFKATGVLYAQQNDATFVCAHVGLRSVLACVLPDKDISYAEINRLAGIDHKSRLVGDVQGGMTSAEIEKVLQGLNVPFGRIVHIPGVVDLPGEYQRDIYGFIESGYPALVGFELDNLPGSTVPAPARNHIIPVFGHTFNEDAWVPDAQRHYFAQSGGYYSSESWLSAYVLHDDNFGPYQCLPRHFLQQKNFRAIYGLQPFKTDLSAVDVEALAFDYLVALLGVNLGHSSKWFDRYVVFAKSGLLLLRTLLVTRDQYLRHLGTLEAREGTALQSQQIDNLRGQVPDQFWMIETTAPELFSATRRKFGEILIRADKRLPKPLDLSLLVGLRLPGVIAMYSNGQLNSESTAVIGHSQLFSYS